MELNVWKRNPRDRELIVEIPFKRVSDIFILQGARMIGQYYDTKHSTSGIMVIVDSEDELHRIITLLKEIKSKGINLEEERWDTKDASQNDE